MRREFHVRFRERPGVRFPRATRRNVYVHSKVAGERVMETLERFLSKRLRLRINREKSAVARPSERKFLGYSVTPQPKSKLMVAPKSVERLKAKLKPIFRRGRGMKLSDTIKLINRATGGWVTYFRLTTLTGVFKQLDGWIRSHLRVIQWRQWKRPASRLKKLCELGLSRNVARSAAFARCGPWRTIHGPAMKAALSNAALARMGYASLLERHQRLGIARAS